MDTVLVVQNLWWPFGSHLYHTKFSLIYALKNGYNFFYKYNNYPCFKNKTIEDYYETISNVKEEELYNYIQEDYNPRHLETSQELHNWKPDNYTSWDEFQSDIIKYIYKPNTFVRKYLEKNSLLNKITNQKLQYIGMHVRWSDKTAGRFAETIPIDIEIYFNKCIEIREKYNINLIILCCDTTDAIEIVNRANDKYKFEIIWNTEEKRCSNNWLESVVQRCNFNNITSHELEEEYLTAFVNFEILLNSFAIVANFDSGFALVAAEYRNNNKDIHIRDTMPRFKDLRNYLP